MTSLPPPVQVTELLSTVRIAGNVLAQDVPYERFLRQYEGQHVEWVNGVVIAMASIDERHDALVEFLRILFKAYFGKAGGGRSLGDPMVMRLAAVPSARAPDIQVLLPERLHQLHQNEVVGPANLVIEIVSAGSRRTDSIDKRREYELGGVPEYWIIDYLRQEATFLQLDGDGLYQPVLPDADGVYTSRELPRLRLAVRLLWQTELPDFAGIARLVDAMFAE